MELQTQEEKRHRINPVSEQTVIILPALLRARSPADTS